MIAHMFIRTIPISYKYIFYFYIQMENISNFLAVCDKLGVAKTDQFQTVDLYEDQNMPQVTSLHLASV